MHGIKQSNHGNMNVRHWKKQMAAHERNMKEMSVKHGHDLDEIQTKHQHGSASTRMISGLRPPPIRSLHKHQANVYAAYRKLAWNI